MKDEIKTICRDLQPAARRGHQRRPSACRSASAEIGRFSDGECQVEITENVRGGDVFVIQSTCTPTNDNIMELLLMLDAFKRASAKRHHRRRSRTTAMRGRTGRSPRASPSAPSSSPTSSPPPARRGCSPSTCMRGRSRASSTSPSTTSTRRRFCSSISASGSVGREVTVVSPDAGGVERARAFAKRLDAQSRDHRQAAQPSERGGRDADHRRRRRRAPPCSSTTWSTRPARSCTAAEAVRARRAHRSVLACATHPVLSGPAIDAPRGVRHRRARRHRHHPAVASRRDASSKIRVLPRRAAARRGHPAHPRGSVDQLAVRVKGF